MKLKSPTEILTLYFMSVIAMLSGIYLKAELNCFRKNSVILYSNPISANKF